MNTEINVTELIKEIEKLIKECKSILKGKESKNDKA